ncbi:pyridoxamine 5'-phosphate oxidase-domain-containing protein [Pseudomassariella vexata]|uniref:Pyridoxamine 5'-phosphate oxidase-domain-containing protein n=1 Tax=Pseudomassariella vexata TaxID=1141098 RepID=A0A1Y2E228_9PEZI|nr:pyridoxamine 5'-phosphate oxidase-domain-containing protein [Pseudomassariella vexata]ORY65376.1 pyridoxamine 5'-phosphate oxidase-domain-containing protein [Pseudomassariella vexata]
MRRLGLTNPLVRRAVQLASHLGSGTIMMSTTTSSASGSAAPWRNLFVEHLEGMKLPEFTLSTVRCVPSSASAGFGVTGGVGDRSVYVPRARTCIFRGMWASLPVNPKNEAELNPEVYESDFPTFTTDVRMDKMAELWGARVDDGKNEWQGTGGGGPVEAVWWAEGPKVQWRVRGRAYVLGPDVETSESGRETREMLRAGMLKRKRQDDGKDGEWSFRREITAHFGNLAPGMRGTFKNPPSGLPIELPFDDGLELGQKVDDLHDETARKNFRVVVIVPYEVDRTDLFGPVRGRRWLYRLTTGGRTEPEMPGGIMEGAWEKVELWP